MNSNTCGDSNKLSEDDINLIKDFPKYRNQSTEKKSLINELIPNEELRERYKKYGLCKECKQPNTGVNWCHPCNSNHFKQEFKKWTSGNEEIDKVIQKFQLSATCYQEVLEWIPYNRFQNIEYLEEGGFSTVYKAEWIDGYILNWDVNQNKWDIENTDVVLKCLKNSKNFIKDFLQETTFYKKFSINNVPIVFCFGISQNPITENFIIVMQYISNGNMSRFLKSNYNRLSLDNKLYLFRNIANGLKEIHNQGCIHKDLHSGNILSFNKVTCFISDLGFCKPVSERANDDKKIFGVLPYVAPEVLRGKPYTQAADIYSFGIVACEILSGLPPYHDSHDLSRDDEHLAIKICQGLRPKFNNIKIPFLLEKLIIQCLDSDPSKRPTADELSDIFNDWIFKVDYNEVICEFYKQFKEAEESNKSILSKLSNTNTTHPQAIYSSRHLDYKNLPDANDQFYKYSDSLKLNFDIGDESLTLDRTVEEHNKNNLERDKLNPRTKNWKCTQEKNKISKAAADHGDDLLDGQLQMFMQGKGVEQEAIEYFIKAAKNDHAATMFSVSTKGNEELGKYYMIKIKIIRERLIIVKRKRFLYRFL